MILMRDRMSEYERWQRDERRAARRAQVIGWGLMILSAVFMVLVLWLAIVGAIVVFG
jgi:hypothetical protein